jgi:hypothetical protein
MGRRDEGGPEMLVGERELSEIGDLESPTILIEHAFFASLDLRREFSSSNR